MPLAQPHLVLLEQRREQMMRARLIRRSHGSLIRQSLGKGQEKFMRKRKPLTTLAHVMARSFAWKSAPLFLAACVVAALSFSARAQEFRVTNVELRANTPELSGPCPLKVTFKGVIEASGLGKVQ